MLGLDSPGLDQPLLGHCSDLANVPDYVTTTVQQLRATKTRQNQIIIGQHATHRCFIGTVGDFVKKTSLSADMTVSTA